MFIGTRSRNNAPLKLRATETARHNRAPLALLRRNTANREEEGTQHAQKIAVAAAGVPAVVVCKQCLFFSSELRAQNQAAANSSRAVHHAVALAH